MMRDLVLGLEVVLANGTVIDAMNEMLKNNAGYDLKQLFIGSEGTLGIVTKAVLRLFPLTTSVRTGLCAVRDFDAALALLRLTKQRLGADLSAFEVMWADFYRLGTSALGRRAPLAEGHAFYVLVEAMGTDDRRDGERFEEFVAAALDDGTVVDAVIAQSLKESQESGRSAMPRANSGARSGRTRPSTSACRSARSGVSSRIVATACGSAGRPSTLPGSVTSPTATSISV
jgi:FAD/FMN-containing dehydrogenase